MPSTGLDRDTGKPLSGLAHVRQSVQVLFTTSIGERVMRRTFGSWVPTLLGRSNQTPVDVLKFFTAAILAIELWEPRFRVSRIRLPSSSNSPDGLRIGKSGYAIQGQYRPNALQGDLTTDVETLDL